SRAAEHGVLDLLKGETCKTLRRPTGLVEHVDKQLEFGLAVDPPVMTNALDQPLRVLSGKVAPRFGLLDKIVSDGLPKAIGPGGILHRTSLVQGKDDVGLLGGDDPIVVVIAPELEDVGILDAAARLDLRDRNRVQYCHSQPSANPGQS